MTKSLIIHKSLIMFYYYLSEILDVLTWSELALDIT